MRTVRCCPHCESTRYKVLVTRPPASNKYCRDCEATFAEPETRPARGKHGAGSDLAAKLIAADPDDVGGSA